MLKGKLQGWVGKCGQNLFPILKFLTHSDFSCASLKKIGSVGLAEICFLDLRICKIFILSHEIFNTKIFASLAIGGGRSSC